MDLQITPKKLSGAVTPPSSKSQAHRLLGSPLLSAAGLDSVIHGLADSHYIRATRRCLSAMCVGMEDLPDGTLRVHGLGTASSSHLPMPCWTAGNQALPCAS